MSKTKIQWTDESINPIRARWRGGYPTVAGHYCEKVSTGCALCYASRMQQRFKMAEFPGLRGNLENVEPFFDDERLLQVLKRKKPTKYFWCDMTDMFGHWVPFEWIDKCFAVMALTPQHIHMVLTKRPERMAEYTQSLTPQRIDDIVDRFLNESQIQPRDTYICRVQHDETYGVPIPNVWLGTSTENQKQADSRIGHLLACPSKIRFLSVEPQLEEISLISAVYASCRLPDSEGFGFDWVIVGGESGNRARPFDPAWAQSIISQCKDAGVACFVKQMGRRPVGLNLKDSHGGDWDEWPDDLKVRQFPEVTP